MRISALIGSILSMAGALGISAASMPVFPDIRPMRTMDFTQPKRRKTGRTYPHSSDRQRARYARQIAAGQIHRN